MSAPIYLGDEVSAAGYRLAGATTCVPAAGDEAAALARARGDAALVLVSAAVASAIGEAGMRAALCALSPLVLVVPDLHGTVVMPDLAQRLRGQLGLEA